MRPRRRHSHLRSLTVIITAALVIPLCSIPASATEADAVTLPSPDGPSSVSARVALDPTEGRVALSVVKQGRELLAPSAIGITTTRADLMRGLKLRGTRHRTVDERYRYELPGPATVTGEASAFR